MSKLILPDIRNGETKKIILLVWVLCICLVIFLYSIYISRDYYKESPPDVTAFINGATMIADGKVSELYNTDFQKTYYHKLLYPLKFEGFLSYRNLPMNAYLYTLYLKMYRVDSYFTYVLFNVAILAIASIFIVRIQDVALYGEGVLGITSAAGGARSFYHLVFLPAFVPLLVTITNVQTTLLITLSLAVCLYLLVVSKPALAGLVMGALLLKVNFLILVPLLVAAVIMLRGFKFGFRFVTGFCLSSALLLLLNIWIYGPDLLPNYVRFITLTEGLSYGTGVNANCNVLALLALFGVDDSPALTWGFGIGVFLYILVFIGVALGARNVLPSVRTKWLVFWYCVALFVSPLLNIHTMCTDLTIMLIPFALLPDMLKNLIVTRFKRLRCLYAFFVWGLFAIPYFLLWLGILKLQYLFVGYSLVLAGVLIVAGHIFKSSNFGGGEVSKSTLSQLA